MIKSSLIVAICLFQNTVTLSQLVVTHVRIETKNFLTGKYEENKSNDYKAIGYQWNVLDMYRKVEFIHPIDDKKLKKDIDYESFTNGDHGSFYILESYLENSSPIKINSSGNNWYIFKHKSTKANQNFVAISNYGNNAIILYNTESLRVFFVCKESTFFINSIELPTQIFSLLTVDRLNANGQVISGKSLTYDLETHGNKKELLYIFENKFFFNLNHARDNSYNHANKDYFNKLLLRYDILNQSSSLNNNTRKYEFLFSEDDDEKKKAKLVFSIPQPVDASKTINIDCLTPNEYFRFSAKQIVPISTITSSDLEFYKSTLTEVKPEVVMQ